MSSKEAVLLGCQKSCAFQAANELAVNARLVGKTFLGSHGLFEQAGAKLFVEVLQKSGNGFALLRLNDEVGHDLLRSGLQLFRAQLDHFTGLLNSRLRQHKGHLEARALGWKAVDRCRHLAHGWLRRKYGGGGGVDWNKGVRPASPA